MTHPICVLAATRRGFEQWLHESGLPAKDVRCCLQRDHLEGMEFRRVVTLSEFWDRPDRHDMYPLALSRVRQEKAA